MEKPYLSIVVTTRNDNHGGDLIERTKCFVEGIYYQSEKNNLPVELIIVDSYHLYKSRILEVVSLELLVFPKYLPCRIME